MTLPSEPDVGRPPFLSDDWEWSEASDAWERKIGDVRLVYTLGYMCIFELEDYDYEITLHTFIYDSVRAISGLDEYDQSEIDQFFGLDTMGQIEGGYDGENYDLAEDLAGIRDDLMDEFKCSCGNNEFYVIATMVESASAEPEYIRTYGCTDINCDNTYSDDAVPKGLSVNITSIHYLE